MKEETEWFLKTNQIKSYLWSKLVIGFLKTGKTKSPYHGLQGQPTSSSVTGGDTHRYTNEDKPSASSKITFLSSYSTVDTFALYLQSHFLFGAYVLLFPLSFVLWPQISTWLTLTGRLGLYAEVTLAEQTSLSKTSFPHNSITDIFILFYFTAQHL